MKREKRKSWVILELAKANDKKQWKSNWIYMMTLAFTIVLLASVCTIVKGKIDTESYDIADSLAVAVAYAALQIANKQKKVKKCTCTKRIKNSKLKKGLQKKK